MTYSLKDVSQQLAINNLLAGNEQTPNITFDSLTFDSREVKSGTLFFCKGANFKVEYLLNAIEKGAIAYVSEEKYPVAIPCLLVTDIREAMPIVANLFYNKPWRQFNLIGITGTKGKTTTTYYLKAIFDRYEASLNKPESAFLTSTEIYDGIDRGAAQLTTPESLDLFKHFDHARRSQVEFLTMEVSSQALKYKRVTGIEFDIIAFLNISEDHISPNEHPTFEDYFNSKLEIFQYSPVAVIDIDADHHDEIMQAARDSGKTKSIITISRQNDSADYYADQIDSQTDGQRFMLHAPDFKGEVNMAMTGIFNVDNALAGIAIARFFAVPYDIILASLAEVKAEGRMEVFATNDDAIKVIVDFAHNKLSFEQLFNAAKSMYSDHEYHIVFGAPGNKGITRRKDLALITADQADEIYITEDDPDFEEVADISNVILSNIHDKGREASIILNRAEAIKTAFNEAAKRDKPVVLLIAGKGNEKTMKVKGKRIPYASDIHYVIENINDYNQRQNSRKKTGF